MKSKYIFLMLGILVTAELHGSWWHRPYQIGANSLKHVMRVAKRHPIIANTTVLLLSILFYFKVRFEKEEKKRYQETKTKFGQTIWGAIKNNNTRWVHGHLKQPGIINDPNLFGDSLLHFAAAYNKPDIINILCNSNPYLIDSQNNCFVTPLYQAVENNSKNAIECLILKDADINAPSDFGSPLDRARKVDEENGNKKMEEFLNQKVAERVQKVAERAQRVELLASLNGQ